MDIRPTSAGGPISDPLQNEVQKAKEAKVTSPKDLYTSGRPTIHESLPTIYERVIGEQCILKDLTVTLDLSEGFSSDQVREKLLRYMDDVASGSKEWDSSIFYKAIKIFVKELSEELKATKDIKNAYQELNTFWGDLKTKVAEVKDTNAILHKELSDALRLVQGEVIKISGLLEDVTNSKLLTEGISLGSINQILDIALGKEWKLSLFKEASALAQEHIFGGDNESIEHLKAILGLSDDFSLDELKTSLFQFIDGAVIMDENWDPVVAYEAVDVFLHKLNDEFKLTQKFKEASKKLDSFWGIKGIKGKIKSIANKALNVVKDLSKMVLKLDKPITSLLHTLLDKALSKELFHDGGLDLIEVAKLINELLLESGAARRSTVS